MRTGLINFRVESTSWLRKLLSFGGQRGRIRIAGGTLTSYNKLMFRYPERICLTQLLTIT
jgi:hypothetical protein